ncbi:membrane protein, partial [Candidatus Magnetomorum sp. HK-1]
MVKWLITNKEWLLSGIGIFILNLLFLFLKKKEKSKYNQISRLQDIKIVGNVEQVINQNKNGEPQKKFTLKLALFFGLLTINISWGALFTYKIC